MKALIIEDEQQAALRLEKQVFDVNPDIEVLAKLDGVESTIAWWNENEPPDFLFMDIHLADGSCFEIFDQITIDRPVIFTTAYDEYALRSFEKYAIDYLLKPIKKQDLERALEKLTIYLRGEEEESVGEAAVADDLSEAGLKRLLVKVGPRINLVKIKDVAYFYSQNKITFAITKEGRRFPIDKSLEYLEHHLDTSFFRINRKFIIHLNSIDGMMGHTKGRVIVQLKPPCEMESVVSTDRSPHFKKWLIA